MLIGRLTGKLLETQGTTVLIDVAGLGYDVEVSATVVDTLPRLGDELILHTHFVVREDAQLLYGFSSKEERTLFRSFIKISGVGPKLGLALISSLDPHALVTAVRSNNVSMLTKVPGVGKKTAERLMVELKNQIDVLSTAGAVPMNVVSASGTSQGVTSEAEDALLALGYRPQQASQAIDTVLQSFPADSLTAQELVRKALRTFAAVSKQV